MSLLIKPNENKNSSSLLSIAIIKTTTSNADVSTRTTAITLDKYPTTTATTTATRKSSSTSLLVSPSVAVESSSIAANSSFISIKAAEQSVKLRTQASSAAGRKMFRRMPSFKIMSYQNIIAFLVVLVCGLATVSGLKCYMCGQYNEGVGSITPCLNYSEQYAHLYLKECTKKSEKYCVKYVSELSIVRDCATECAEKEIWETQTYCCTEDGCNGSSALGSSAAVVLLPLIIFYILNEVMNIIKQQRR